jgi:hypothetical protein
MRAHWIVSETLDDHDVRRFTNLMLTCRLPETNGYPPHGRSQSCKLLILRPQIWWTNRGQTGHWVLTVPVATGEKNRGRK